MYIIYDIEIIDNDHVPKSEIVGFDEEFIYKVMILIG